MEDARARGGTVFHPAGTCRMASDRDAVVDSTLRVHGAGNLRVIDASIMPTITSGNTNGPCIMIGEMARSLFVAAISGDAIFRSPSRPGPG